jgi:dolichol-phosphate mannosyltransferase
VSASRPHVVILVPTYNEAENIIAMLEALEEVEKRETDYRFTSFVVDDESPDGTAGLVSDFMRAHPSVELLEKPKQGLGIAMIAGYEHAIEVLRADIVASIDCDFQWDPNDIPALLAELASGADVAIGSRHLPGGSMEGWSIDRRFTHWVANTVFATWIAGTREVTDHNGNFRAIRVRGVLDQVSLRDLPVRGYGFFNLMIYALSRIDAKFSEVPIIFRWRELGETKVGFSPKYFPTFVRDTLEYMRLCFWIRRDRSTRRT